MNADEVREKVRSVLNDVYADIVGGDWERNQDRSVDRLLALLNSSQAKEAGGAEGWKLVPAEPTEEMIKAADDANADYRTVNLRPQTALGPEAVWSAMIAATPAHGNGEG